MVLTIGIGLVDDEACLGFVRTRDFVEEVVVELLLPLGFSLCFELICEELVTSIVVDTLIFSSEVVEAVDL